MSEASRPVPSKPAALSSSVRRIVNGHDANGQVVVQSDTQQVFEATPWWGLEGAAVWTTSETPSKDNNAPVDFDGAQRKVPGMGLVSRNGTNCRYTDLAPGGVAPLHRTSSIDYNILLYGSLISITESGHETLIQPGDVVVQKGTMHSWRNPGPDWARWVSVLVDAEPATVNGTSLEDAWEQ